MSEIREFCGGVCLTTVGERIRYARKMSNLTLTDVKNFTGLSTGNLSDLENDKFMPSSNSLISFREVFNVSIDWILTGQAPANLSNCQVVKENPIPYLTDEDIELIETYRTLDEDRKRDIKGFIHVVTQCRNFKPKK